MITTLPTARTVRHIRRSFSFKLKTQTCIINSIHSLTKISLIYFEAYIVVVYTEDMLQLRVDDDTSCTSTHKDTSNVLHPFNSIQSPTVVQCFIDDQCFPIHPANGILLTIIFGCRFCCCGIYSSFLSVTPSPLAILLACFLASAMAASILDSFFFNKSFKKESYKNLAPLVCGKKAHNKKASLKA